MSSLQLREKPKPAEHRESVCEALLDVAENSFFSYAEPCDEVRFAELVAAESAAGTWLRGTVVFDGAFRGEIQVDLPESLARQLLVSFAGMSPEDETPEWEVFDSTGEFTNMICGAWLTRSCRRRKFVLRPPDVVRMAPGWQPGDEQAGSKDDGSVFASIDDLPVRIGVSFSAGEE